MRTDLMIKMMPNEQGELHILKPFIIHVLFFADDGFLYEIRFKQFDVEFKAKDLVEYVKDCAMWPMTDSKKFNELKTIYYEKAVKKPIPV